jgi:hypothetical protein
MALLVEYPLSISVQEGDYLIPNANSFSLHFAKIFPESLRKQIISEPFEEIFCTNDGIAYLHGLVWIDATHHNYRLQSVSLPQTGKETAPARRIDLVCRTPRLKAIADSDPKSRNSESRLRIWNAPHSISVEPDLTMPGKESMEGTGSCRHSFWKFKGQTAEISIDDARGCFERGSDPPKGTIGRITITDSKGQETSDWCY